MWNQHVSTGSGSRSRRVVLRIGADEIVEPDGIFFRREAPDAGWRRRGLQLLGNRAEQEFVIEVVALERMQMGGEAPLVGESLLESAGYPGRNLNSFQQVRLFFFVPGRHLPERHHFPDTLPLVGIFRCDLVKPAQREAALRLCDRRDSRRSTSPRKDSLESKSCRRRREAASLTTAQRQAGDESQQVLCVPIHANSSSIGP